jgi:AMMECR1 domain-containing protein
MKAFPNVTNEKGMDLRDYFAAAAMQADLATYDGANWRRVAVQAYQMADEMMKEREKP